MRRGDVALQAGIARISLSQMFGNREGKTIALQPRRQIALLHQDAANLFV
jgi:hypothetical protein